MGVISTALLVLGVVVVLCGKTTRGQTARYSSDYRPAGRAQDIVQRQILRVERTGQRPWRGYPQYATLFNDNKVLRVRRQLWFLWQFHS